MNPGIKTFSRRTQPFQESVIREMTRIGAEIGGVDLAQGLPNFDPPAEVIEALQRIILDGLQHQYTFTWGSPELRAAVAQKYAHFNNVTADPDTEITITCGVSEALISTIIALTEPGDEVIIFEPWYENYVPACILAGVYEHIWYDDHRHISLGSLPGMEDRTVTLSGLGKSYAVTGWRVGWAVAAAPLTALIRKVHDYLTVCAPAPFQEAGCVALTLPDTYYNEMRAKYAVRRSILIDVLSQVGFRFTPPEGAYYVMVDAAPLGWHDDRAFVEFLARQVGVIAVPGSSFYAGSGGKTRARLNFAKREETLHEAAHRLLHVDLRAPGKAQR